MKFAFYLGSRGDNDARQMIIKARWQISLHDDKQIRKQLLNFIDTMEKTRFPDGQNNI